MDKVVSVKVVLLGRNAVGKTCLVKRYVDDVFRESDRYQNTIGACFVSKSVKRGKRTAILNLWDTAGEEKFSSMTRLYYRGANVAIVCYDLNDDRSFERVRFWVEELLIHEQSCRVYLCGTKKDLLKGHPKINPDMVASYAQDIGAKITETSSKTGENIDELFQMIVTDTLSTSSTSDRPNTSENSGGTIALHSTTTKKKCCKR